jgi:hypothetical protein
MSDSRAGSQFATHSITLIADHLAGLNPKQREAAEYGVRPGKTKNIGPLLVIAGAGSGKTKTLSAPVYAPTEWPRQRICAGVHHSFHSEIDSSRI